MVNYICPRCGFTNNIKTKYMNHLKRKKICEPILSKTNLQKEYIKYGIIDKILIPQNNTISTTENVELHKFPRQRQHAQWKERKVHATRVPQRMDVQGTAGHQSGAGGGE